MVSMLFAHGASLVSQTNLVISYNLVENLENCQNEDQTYRVKWSKE